MINYCPIYYWTGRQVVSASLGRPGYISSEVTGCCVLVFARSTTVKFNKESKANVFIRLSRLFTTLAVKKKNTQLSIKV